MKTSILIVEDENSIYETINFALEKHGMVSRWARNAKDAISLVKGEAFQMILLDVGLPDKDGFEVLKEIRRIHNTPVIMLTAQTEEIDRVLGLELGADDYLGKPFSPRELVARIKAILRRTSNQHNAKNDSIFVIDEKLKCIFVDKQKLNLSRYEFGILELFINHPGMVFSREKIMDIIWDEDEMSLDRTVDTHIKNIRSQIKKIIPDCDPIQTRRGMGYAFEENS